MKVRGISPAPISIAETTVGALKPEEVGGVTNVVVAVGSTSVPSHPDGPEMLRFAGRAATRVPLLVVAVTAFAWIPFFVPSPLVVVVTDIGALVTVRLRFVRVAPVKDAV